MANGKVDDLAWSQLRPRQTIPQFVTNSIPPEDMQAFLKLVATNPLLPFAEASAVFSKIISLRQWRTESANPNTVTKQFEILRPLLARSHLSKRRRDDEITAPSGDMSTDDTPATDSEDEQPKRKQRRSTRPTLNSEIADTSPGRNASRGVPPKIGPEFQAEVPLEALPAAERRKQWPKVTSKLTYSAPVCGGDENVTAFLNSMNKAVRRRDGFPLTPFALEKCLQLLTALRGHKSSAAEKVLPELPRGPYFPGIQGHFGYEEQCLFVRALAEKSKNFSAMAREVLTTRSASELVWLYYTRHKQLWLQNGGMKHGLVLDDGGEKLKRVPLTSERTISALRSLAITAGDGFPIDNRVLLAIAACRRGNLARERRKRDEENLRRGSRTRW